MANQEKKKNQQCYDFVSDSTNFFKLQILTTKNINPIKMIGTSTLLAALLALDARVSYRVSQNIRHPPFF